MLYDILSACEGAFWLARLAASACGNALNTSSTPTATVTLNGVETKVETVAQNLALFQQKLNANASKIEALTVAMDEAKAQVRRFDEKIDLFFDSHFQVGWELLGAASRSSDETLFGSLCRQALPEFKRAAVLLKNEREISARLCEATTFFLLDDVANALAALEEARCVRFDPTASNADYWATTQMRLEVADVAAALAGRPLWRDFWASCVERFMQLASTATEPRTRADAFQAAEATRLLETDLKAARDALKALYVVDGEAELNDALSELYAAVFDEDIAAAPSSAQKLPQSEPSAQTGQNAQYFQISVVSEPTTRFFLKREEARFQWRFDEEGAWLCGYSGGPAEVVVPETAEGRPVVGIDAEVFKDNASLKSIVFPDSLQTIGDGAFEKCKALQKVAFPDSLQAIGNRAFDCCWALQNVTFGAGLQTIGYCAFYCCWALQNVTFGAGLQTIGDNAFGHCSALQNVTFGAGLQMIGDRAFSHCSALQNVAFPDSLQTIDDSAFEDCKALQSLTFGAGLQTIGDSAFKECKALRTVTFGAGLQTIGDSAFEECKALQSLTFGAGLQTIGDWAFNDCCALQSVTFGAGLQTIGKCAFKKCEALRTVTLGAGLQTIGDRAFGDCCALQSVTFGAGLQTIGDYAFADTALWFKKVELPRKTKVGEDAFPLFTRVRRVKK